MRLGIDASNLRTGGGVTHLIELLRTADPLSSGFSQIIVWSGTATLSRVEDRPWLVKSHQPSLDKSLPYRTFWQRFRLSKVARACGCEVLLVPGGSYVGDFRPVVTMSRNLLPFEWREMRRYGWSLMTLKLMMLRMTQSRTFYRSDGLVFLTQYAHDVVMQAVKMTSGQAAIIPHGINERFLYPPREQKPVSRYSTNRPYRILYVSIIDMYKHQWHVAEAVAQLRESGLPIVLDLVGPTYPPALKLLKRTMYKIDPTGEYINYLGPMPHEILHSYYAKADLCVFASSCENMPNILIEGMASGLPIACSNRGPMREVLGEGGVYFDPEDPDDIAHALRELIYSSNLRTKLAKAAFKCAQSYSWAQCAKETFSFISQVACKSQVVGV